MISIHTPHAGSDRFHRCVSGLVTGFQSTLPMRGATFWEGTDGWEGGISIHTPHAGSDDSMLRIPSFPFDFNPHSPCGERLCHDLFEVELELFQSTLPMRGATDGVPGFLKMKSFQSTLPMRGATHTGY